MPVCARVCVRVGVCSYSRRFPPFLQQWFHPSYSLLESISLNINTSANEVQLFRSFYAPEEHHSHGIQWRKTWFLSIYFHVASLQTSFEIDIYLYHLQWSSNPIDIWRNTFAYLSAAINKSIPTLSLRSLCKFPSWQIFNSRFMYIYRSNMIKTNKGFLNDCS